jgi:small multidrug resistance family-3 protein
LIKAITLFILAGLAEIGGGYLIWQWLREGKTGWLGLIGGILLFLYGVVATLQVFPNFGRVYAAYGGVFIVMSLFWGWWVDKKVLVQRLHLFERGICIANEICSYAAIPNN